MSGKKKISDLVNIEIPLTKVTPNDVGFGMPVIERPLILNIEVRRKLVKIIYQCMGKPITDQLISSIRSDCVSLLEDYVMRDLSRGETDTNVTVGVSGTDIEIVWPEWFRPYLLCKEVTEEEDV
jgi:hypothetical protein